MMDFLVNNLVDFNIVQDIDTEQEIVAAVDKNEKYRKHKGTQLPFQHDSLKFYILKRFWRL